MAPLETAVNELRQILAADSTAPEWRWNVRRRLSEVKDALSGPQARQADAWLAARASSSNRVRHQLHARGERAVKSRPSTHPPPVGLRRWVTSVVRPCARPGRHPLPPLS